MPVRLSRLAAIIAAVGLCALAACEVNTPSPAPVVVNPPQNPPVVVQPSSPPPVVVAPTQ